MLAHFDAVCRDLDAKRVRVLEEIHPALRIKVEQVLAMLGGRVTPYCGYRGPHEQAAALAAGTSNAAFGESPHNFQPALACDLVLDPRMVDVRENPDKAHSGYPDCWDDESLPAASTWADLDTACAQVGLERVTVRGRKDLPHVQLAGWEAIRGTPGG